jgi:spermidine synthase
MIQRELLGSAWIPGGGELCLYRHDRDFMIVLGGNELMSSRMSGSEIALAAMTCDRIKGRKRPRLLIGGYGMGFTLRAALAALGRDAELVLAELVPEVIEWAQGPMQELEAGCLRDPRVQLVYGDVYERIANPASGYDAILLDVDNGPDGLVRKDNNRIYNGRGLRAAKAALRPGGVLAIWSAARDDSFKRHLAGSGFSVDQVIVPARSNGKGPKHVICFAVAE